MNNDQNKNQHAGHEYDEVLVKNADGTFRTVKVPASLPFAQPHAEHSASSVPAPVPSVPRPVPAAFVPLHVPETPHVATTPPPVSAPLRETPVSAPSGGVAGAWLDPEEEKEIRQFSGTAPTHTPDAMREKGEEVLRLAGIRGMDDVTRDRLLMAVALRMKEVRNDAESREALMKSREQGGAALSAPDAERILSTIIRLMGGEAKRAAVIPIVTRPSLPPRPSAPVAPAMPQLVRPVQQPSPVPTKPVQPIVMRLKKETPRVVVASAPFPEQPRRTVQDIAIPRVIKGPVDELRMTHDEWERLAKTPVERARNVEEKLRLLQEETLVERLRGVRAWQESEVMHTYRSVIGIALAQQKPIADVLGEQVTMGRQNVFTSETMNAIAELNARISS